MIRKGNLGLVAAALALGACGSAPTHFYTLVAPVSQEPAASVVDAKAFQFDLLPVSVPAQVDQPPLVVRQGGQAVVVLQGQRWVAPLGDEVRGALSADLTRDFRALDVSGLPNQGKATIRIKLDVRRFDSVPGSYAYIDAAWSVRTLKGGDALACTSRISEPVGAGYDALVQGHQQAISRLAGQIGAVAGLMATGQTPNCPQS